MYLDVLLLIIIAVSVVAVFMYLLYNRSSRMLIIKTKELFSEKTKLRTMINSIPDTVFAKDLDSKYIMINQNFMNFFNLREEDVIGKGDIDGLNFDEELAKEVREMDLKIINEKITVQFEELIPGKNGEKILYETIKVPLEENGKVIGLMAVSRDITQRKAMEEAVLAANRAKSEFLSNMSHEIRTPLNAITGMTTLGKDADTIERKNYCFNKIEEASKHLLDIINDILDVSKIEANKMELSDNNFNFEKMLQRVLDIIGIQTTAKKQTLKLNIDSNIPVYLLGDNLRLAQIIMNLLGNAVKFTPENGIIFLDVKLLGEENGVCRLLFSVTDNGIGVSADNIDKLFDSFQQGDSGTARKYGGTGLGLTISKKIAQLMGGEIFVESEAGKGANFSFTANIKRSNEYADTDDTEKTNVLTNNMSKIFAGKHILLVEDIAINCEIVKKFLEPTEVKIDVAENGAEALQAFIEYPDRYDLILMDLQMPQMDGYEATQKIRALDIEKAKNIPIIAMTANVFTEDVERCLQAGMNDHIGKPLDFNLLLNKLHNYIV